MDSTKDRVGLRRSSTLTSIARDAIEQLIISGELSAGDRINESALAARFDISRGPIREACRSLEYAGLIRNVTNHGAYVREMSLAEARELYEVRRALTALIGELLVERVTPEIITELEAMVAKMAVAAEQEDLDAYYQLNLNFHAAMMDHAGNAALAHYYDGIIKQLHLFRRKGLVQQGNLKASNAEHVMIVKAIAARDASQASKALSDHVMSGWERLEHALTGDA